MESRYQEPRHITTLPASQLYPLLQPTLNSNLAESRPDVGMNNSDRVSRQLLSVVHRLLSEETAADLTSFKITNFFVSLERSEITKVDSVKPGASVYIHWTMNQPPEGCKITLSWSPTDTLDLTKYSGGSFWYPPEDTDLPPLILIKSLTLVISLSMIDNPIVINQYSCEVSVINPTVALFKSYSSTYTVDQGVSLDLQWIADAKYCCLHGANPGISLIKQPAIVNKYKYVAKETGVLSLIPYYDNSFHGSPSMLHLVVRNPQLLSFEVKSGASKETFDESTPLIINASGKDLYRYDLLSEILDSKGVLQPLKLISTSLSQVKDYKWSPPDLKWAVKENQGHGPAYPLRITVHVQAYSDAHGTDGQGDAQVMTCVMTPKFLNAGHVKIIYLKAAEPRLTSDGRF